MNIRYIQSNIKELSQDNLIKFLYDLILNDIGNVNNYQNGNVYYKGDRVYLQENGKHQIFQCIVDTSSLLFKDDEWEYIMETFEGEISTCSNLTVKEEVHIIDESTVNSIYTNLDLDSTNMTVALYCGKRRYVKDYDFDINGNNIIFKTPFNIIDRVILEIREFIGQVISVGIILYDLNKNPYNVYINNLGIVGIKPYDTTNKYDVKYGELATGDRTYTLLVDGGSKPYELKAYRYIETYITGTNDNMYKVEIIDDKLVLTETDRGDCFSDTKIILGLDKKFYTLDNVNGEIVATEYIDELLDIRNYDVGVRVLTDRFEQRVVCIDNGIITILPYVDNGGYHNINFIDRANGNIFRLFIDDNNDLRIDDGISTDGYSGTKLLDYFYFFDEDWSYHRMFVEDGLLMFEDCIPDVIPDSRGINMMKKDGELVKIVFDNVEGSIYDAKYINLNNLGTFESPIEGFVINVNNETKLVTINKTADAFELVDTNLPFRTNHHYILATNNDLYKLQVTEDNNISFIKVDNNDYNIDSVTIGAFIKSNEIITRFDIIDGECVFNPISTFVHRIKSNDTGYVMDVYGEPYQEFICFTNINNVEFDVDVGYGNLYLKDEEGNAYVLDIDKNGNVNVMLNEPLSGVDYDITSLIQSSQGWYKITMDGQNIKLEKLFDNMYENIISYGNMIKKSLSIQGMNGKYYSLSANGLGEIVVNEIDKSVDVSGLILRSDDGYNYGLGIMGDQFTTYRSYVTNTNVVEELYVKDIVNNNTHVLYMSGDKLCSRTSNNYVSATALLMYDVYQNKFKIEFENDILKVSDM